MKKSNNANLSQGDQIAKEAKGSFSQKMIDQLNGISISEKIKGKKEFLYKFQLEEKGENSDSIAKGKRIKLRRELERFSNNILLFAKQKMMNKEGANEKLQNEIKAFNAFYEREYISNDYSLKSIYAGNEERKIKEYSILLELIKEA